MSGEGEDLVLAQHRAFYRALSDCNLEAMDRVWLHAPWVRCIHPGWELLIGWDAVRASWEGIFGNQPSHIIEAGDVTVRFAEELSWVSAIERIRSRGSVSFTAATNLFHRTEHGWRMVLHHASILPVTAVPDVSELDEPPGLVH